LAELGIVRSLLDPLRAALLAALLLALLSVFPALGLLRTGALLGAILTVVAAYVPAVNTELERAPGPRGPFLATLAAALSTSLGAGVGAEALVPFRDLALHGGDVLFVLDHPRGHHVMTRAQRSLAVFSNDVLAVTSLDTPRFADALVHPALAAHGQPRRVLVFGNGVGSVEHEVLRYPSVTELTSVVPDRRLSGVARVSSLFTELAPAIGGRSRLDQLESEAAPFVRRARSRGERYSIVLADFGDPSSYLEGKHYTRAFFQELRALLEPAGLLAIQITSPLRTPRAHATILATLESAGFTVLPYRAPLPTLGEWGYALAADGGSRSALRTRLASARVPRGTRLVTTENLSDLFVQPPDGSRAPPAPPAVNHLYDQPLVGLYQDEEHALWN
jgi:spermidine synthase